MRSLPGVVFLLTIFSALSNSILENSPSIFWPLSWCSVLLYSSATHGGDSSSIVFTISSSLSFIYHEFQLISFLAFLNDRMTFQTYFILICLLTLLQKSWKFFLFFPLIIFRATALALLYSILSFTVLVFFYIFSFFFLLLITSHSLSHHRAGCLLISFFFAITITISCLRLPFSTWCYTCIFLYCFCEFPMSIMLSERIL